MFFFDFFILNNKFFLYWLSNFQLGKIYLKIEKLNELAKNFNFIKYQIHDFNMSFDQIIAVRNRYLPSNYSFDIFIKYSKRELVKIMLAKVLQKSLIIKKKILLLSKTIYF